jgi:hypothetical protein
MLNIKTFNTPIIISKVEDHIKNKNLLLKIIEETPGGYFDTIYHTDWNLDSKIRDIHTRKWEKIFYPMIKSNLEETTDFLKAAKWTIIDGWFQQYVEGNYHEWHIHENCNYANVYFLELENPSHATQLYDTINNKIIDIPVCEGDLLTFPANIPHRSPKIIGQKRKTIISFNSYVIDNAILDNSI